MSINLRLEKGSELTFSEVDENFKSLYYSSSLDGETLNFYFTGSNPPVSESISLSGIGGTQSLITNRQSGSSYTLTSGDVNLLVEMNTPSGSSNTVTVPSNASASIDIGSQLVITQYGAGQTTIAAGSGVTLRSAQGYLKLAYQYSAASLVKIDTDEWYVYGDLTL